MKKQFAFCVDQNNFSLLENIQEAKRFEYRF